MHHMPRVKIFKNDLFGGLVSGEFCMHHMSKLFRNQLIEGLVSAVIVRIIRPGPNSSRIGQLKVSFLFFCKHYMSRAKLFRNQLVERLVAGGFYGIIFVQILAQCLVLSVCFNLWQSAEVSGILHGNPCCFAYLL